MRPCRLDASTVTALKGRRSKPPPLQHHLGGWLPPPPPSPSHFNRRSPSMPIRIQSPPRRRWPLPSRAGAVRRQEGLPCAPQQGLLASSSLPKQLWSTLAPLTLRQQRPVPLRGRGTATGLATPAESCRARTTSAQDSWRRRSQASSPRARAQDRRGRGGARCQLLPSSPQTYPGGPARAPHQHLPAPTHSPPPPHFRAQVASPSRCYLSSGR